MKSHRVLSGVQPTGNLHLGNYLGALRKWVGLQDEYECYFCVVDLHALTIPEKVDPEQLRENTLKTAALYLASGIDRQRSTVFVQGDITAHSEMGWLLTCLTPVGWVQRMPQYNTKKDMLESVGSGLLCYPILQAADILLYSPKYVPVGEDQMHHIQLARDIAQRFNSMYGTNILTLPERMTPPQGARIMSLTDPTSKMSKSNGDVVGMLDTPKQIRKAFMSAVTDSNNTTIYTEASAGVRNLINILSAITGESPGDIGTRLDGKGYGYLKLEVAEAVVDTLRPIQDEYKRLRGDDMYLREVLAEGMTKARGIASSKLHQVRYTMGLGRR